jgi:hypothetical protein
VVGAGSQTGEGGAVRAGRSDGVQVRPTGGIGARRGSVDSGRGVREKERERGRVVVVRRHAGSGSAVQT